MKSCPFCAESIQDAAKVCRFCSRELPASPPARAVTPVVEHRKRMGRFWLVLFIVGGLAIVGYLASLGSRSTTGAPGAGRAPNLQISAGRGLFTFSLTNRETNDLRDCTLAITDAQGTMWIAAISTDVAPLETVTVAWSSFSAAGQPMPNYLKDRRVFVVCDVKGELGRRSAGVER